MKKAIIAILISSLMLTACASKTNKVEDTKNTTQSSEEDNETKTSPKENDKTTESSGNSANANTISTKQEYITKLDKLKSDLKASSDKRYAGPSTLEMVDAGSAENKLWDDMLNEIYSVLKGQLSKTEMDKLTVEEVNWIKIRDDKATADAAKYEGGTMQPLMYVTSLIGSTETRCYELVNGYMK